MTQKVVIIGAGIGGLAAAVSLLSRGIGVVVLEKEATPGGKMRQVSPQGRPMDAGPTVFTMKPVFDALFAAAGTSVEAELSLTRLDILARHAWDIPGQEERIFDLHADVHAAADAIGVFAGAAEARGFQRFTTDARRVFETLDQSFMRAPRPSPLGLLRAIGPSGVAALMLGQPFRSLWDNLGRYFADPRLRQLFARYATYCGASPYAGPGTLMLIAHAELMGVWTLKGGMHALARAMERLILRMGGTIQYQNGAHSIEIQKSRAQAVITTAGKRIETNTIVFNGDVSALGSGLLGEAARRATPATPAPKRSLSAVTWCLDAPVRDFPLSRHNVFFASDYRAEFNAIFGERRVPATPTVYVCAEDRDGGTLSDGSLPASDRLLCLINAPADAEQKPLSERDVDRARDAAFGLLARCGLKLDTEAPMIAATPSTFEELFPGTGGAIYGRAGHGPFSPFQRMGSRSHVPGLYLAGGSVHPSAGVPMATISGMLAADAIVADRTGDRR